MREEDSTMALGTGSRLLATSFGPIEYAEAGEGPAVLVIHGAGGGFDQGLEVADELIRNGFHVIAPSRFGYLRTPLPEDAAPAAQADAYAALLDALDISRCAVFGVSAGGPSAMQFGIRHPDRITALVLMVPAAYAPRAHVDTPPKRMSALPGILMNLTLRSDFFFGLAVRFAPRAMTRVILGTPPELLTDADPTERARVQAALEHILPVSRRRLGLLNDGAIVPTLPRFELERVEAPTLIISAQDDLYQTFAGSRYSAEHIPNARFIGYQTGGHLLVGHQHEVTAEIARFLRANAAETEDHMTGFIGDIEHQTEQNRDFRRVLFTGAHLQLVLMSVAPGDELGEEVHPATDQFFRIEGGKGELWIDGRRTPVEEDMAIVVPAGARHNLKNTGHKPLKLYTVDAPPQHPDGTVHRTKSDAGAAEHAVR
jgi:pimeloyl-ACP methyl ester carboxylesterase/mannose-6-phosphate isomerase-like protein (cupin superfamily)